MDSSVGSLTTPRWRESGCNDAKRLRADTRERLGPASADLHDSCVVDAAHSQTVLSPGVHVDSRPAVSSAQAVRCYEVMWRNHQARKHKTWEGDGILIKRDSGATLKDRDTGKEIAQGLWTSISASHGDELSLGSKEIQIDAEIDPRDVYSGKAFSKLGGPPSAPDAIAMSVLGIKKTLKKPVSKFEPAFFSSSGPGDKVFTPLYGIPHKRPQKVPVPAFDPNESNAIVMPSPDSAHQKRYNQKGLPVVHVVVDPQIATYLRPHQVEGVKFLYECVMGMKTKGQGAILADEMGLGKTIQSIALCWTLLKQNPYAGGNSVIKRALVVCPVTLVENWIREFRKWLGENRAGVCVVQSRADLHLFCSNRTNQVVIIGYERLRVLAGDIKKMQPPVGLVICDEGHRLKSAGTKLVQALRFLNTPRRIILTGTPIQNDLGEFHAMVDWINPNALDSYRNFKRMYEMPIIRSRDPNCTEQTKELGIARSSQLQHLAQQFVLRRTYDVIRGFLPPRYEHILFVAPTELQTSMYQAILKSNLFKDIFSRGETQHLVLISSLRKLCNSPGLLYKRILEGKSAKDFGSDDFGSHFPKDIDWSDVDLSGKLLALHSILRILKAYTEEKVVLVSHSTQVLDLFALMCNRSQYKYCRLDGSTPSDSRQNIVDAFNRSSPNKHFIFLLSAKAGGAGLNLVGASRLILFDSDWNPSTDLQAMARIHRVRISAAADAVILFFAQEGQKRACHIYRLLTTEIFQRQIAKAGLANSIMHERNYTPSSASDAFTLDELRDIFKFHAATDSQTHDMLGCKCDGDVLSSQDGTENEDETLLPAMQADFKPASQYEPYTARYIRRRQNLAALHEWKHVKCSGLTAIEHHEDAVLRAFVLASNSTLREHTQSFGAPKASAQESGTIEHCNDLSNISNSNSHETFPCYHVTDDTRRFGGGHVTFMFHRSQH